MKTVYIIMGEYGEYEDLKTWLVSAFLDKEVAQQYMEKATLHVKQIQCELRKTKDYFLVLDKFDRSLGERISQFDNYLKDVDGKMWIGIDKEVTYHIEETSLLEYE